MQWVLRWYLMVQLLGLLAVVIGRVPLRRLPDAGWCVAKTLGVLFAGLLLWLGTAAGLLRNEPGGAVLAVLALAAVAAARAQGLTPARALRWARSRRRLLLAGELLFLAAFAGAALLRAHDPAADHTEQPMDLLMLVAAGTSPEYPPLDPWLAGEPVSYYYLGYWLAGTLAHLAGTPPGLAYNVAQACWFALLLLTCFGLVANVLATGRAGRESSAVAGGVLAALAVGVGGNLHSLAEWVRAAATGVRPEREGWWWWRASRPFRDLDPSGQPLEVIVEFPAFSYLLGDLHPHLLAMPFLAAVATVGLATVLRDRASATSGAGPVPAADGPGVGLLILASGPLLAINTWDYPAALLLLVAATAAAARGTPRERFLAAARRGVVLLLGGVALCLPHLLTAASQVRGVLPNLFHPTPPLALGVVFGTFVPGLVLLLALAARERLLPVRPALTAAAAALAAAVAVLGLGTLWAATTAPGQAWLEAAAKGAPAPLGIAAARWAAGWPSLLLLAGAGACGAAALRATPRDEAAAPRFVLLLAAAGLLVAGVPETIYLHDVFGTRMNTVFKLHYQAWLLLALAATGATALAWRRGGAFRAGAAASLATLACGVLYVAEAVPAKLAHASRPIPTLDALAHLQERAPDELAAIRWLRRHTRPGDVVVQAAGDSYRPEHGRVAAATGRATLLGWRGHEVQWRGSRYVELAAGREEALSAVYSGSPGRVVPAAERWGVDYVVVGPLERERYGIDATAEEGLASVMEPAFASGSVRVFRRRGGGGPTP